MLRSLDLNRLRFFYFVYRERSVSHAAQQLHVTPSAVSQQLHKLENEIGVHLFTRLHKRLAPTAEGERLHTLIKPVFDQLVSGLQEIQNSRSAVSGMIRIGAPTELGKQYFPGMIAAFRKQYQNTRFSLILGNTEKILEMLKEGKLDSAVIDLFLQQEQYFNELGIFHIEPLVDETIILACSKRYYEQHLVNDLSMENLLEQPFISYDSSSRAVMGWFKHHYDRKGVSVNTVLMVDSVQAVVESVKSDIGLGVVTRNSIMQPEGEDDFVTITSGRDEIVNKISLVQLQDKIPTYTEKKFHSHLKEFLENVCL